MALAASYCIAPCQHERNIISYGLLDRVPSFISPLIRYLKAIHFEGEPTCGGLQRFSARSARTHEEILCRLFRSVPRGGMACLLSRPAGLRSLRSYAARRRICRRHSFGALRGTEGRPPTTTT